MIPIPGPIIEFFPPAQKFLPDTAWFALCCRLAWRRWLGRDKDGPGRHEQTERRRTTGVQFCPCLHNHE
jgi:hypothetical protein